MGRRSWPLRRCCSFRFDERAGLRRCLSDKELFASAFFHTCVNLKLIVTPSKKTAGAVSKTPKKALGPSEDPEVVPRKPAAARELHLAATEENVGNRRSDHATPTGMLVNGAKRLGQLAILPRCSLVVVVCLKSGTTQPAAR